MTSESSNKSVSSDVLFSIGVNASCAGRLKRNRCGRDGNVFVVSTA